MQTCGNPIDSPICFPIFNWLNTLKTGMTASDFQLGVAKVAVNMAIGLILLRIFPSSDPTGSWIKNFMKKCQEYEFVHTFVNAFIQKYTDNEGNIKNVQNLDIHIQEIFTDKKQARYMENWLLTPVCDTKHLPQKSKKKNKKKKKNP